MLNKQVFATGIITIIIGPFMAVACAQPLQAERAEDWEALFDRDSGWTGADGIYAIQLNTQATDPNAKRILFVFSDTFIGDVLPDGSRAPGATIVNNTMALLRGTQPVEENIKFYWATNQTDFPVAAFRPQTPDSEMDNWYWLMDGVSINGTFYLFALRMEVGDGGPFNFAVAGVVRISAELSETGPFPHRIRNLSTQEDAPLFLAGDETQGDFIFGSSIMVNTKAAGSSAPDGYVYIYGTQNDSNNKKLLAARVLPEDFADFSAWRFWNGGDWVTAIEESNPVAGITFISSEQSVSPLPDGRFAVVSQYFGLAPEIQIHIGSSPVGPFNEPVFVWVCPEAFEDPDIFCYNAKAQPALSSPGELLISYSVNTFDFFDLFADADIYRPRFIRVTLPE